MKKILCTNKNELINAFSEILDKDAETFTKEDLEYINSQFKKYDCDSIQLTWCDNGVNVLHLKNGLLAKSIKY